MADGKSQALIAALVPPAVMCSEQIGETELLSPNIVSKRREEFTAGRTSARTALAMLESRQLPFFEACKGSRYGRSML